MIYSLTNYICDTGVTSFVHHLKELGGLRALTNAPIMALTASANSDIQVKITSSLHLIDPVVVACSLDRPNIFFSVSDIKSSTVCAHLPDSMFIAL